MISAVVAGASHALARSRLLLKTLANVTIVSRPVLRTDPGAADGVVHTAAGMEAVVEGRQAVVRRPESQAESDKASANAPVSAAEMSQNGRTCMDAVCPRSRCASRRPRNQGPVPSSTRRQPPSDMRTRRAHIL
jgi:hypothetical protein